MTAAAAAPAARAETDAAPPLPSRATVIVFAACAALLASAAPLVAYAGSLALLGAPHALAELRYVDGRFSRRIGRARGVAIAAALAVVVTIRALVLTGKLAASAAATAELTILAALALLVVPGLRTHPLRAAIAVGVGGALALGAWTAPVLTVVVLAILHNATPVGFLAERDDVRGRVAAPLVALFVGVPLVVASGVPSRLLESIGLHTTGGAFASAGSLADHLRVFVPPGLLDAGAAPSIFAACAYLQILHYGVVLGVLPRLARDDRPAAPWPRAPVLAAAIGAAGIAFALWFVRDFVPARAGYGLLASVHAWIEVPVLLLALAPCAAAAGSTADTTAAAA